MSTVPSGEWFCPGCDVYFENVAELCDPDTVLSYHRSDPYLDDFLLLYVRSGLREEFLPPLEARRLTSLRQRAVTLRAHPRLPDWLLIYKSVGGAPAAWLVCPPLSYRWDVIRSMHDVLGHAGVNQTAAQLQQHFYWRGLRSDVELFV